MSRVVVRILTWSAGRIPTLIVWAGLAGLFAYGASHRWKFGERPAKEGEAKEKAEEPEPASFSTYFQERPFDVPIQITHDPNHCPVFSCRMRSPEAGGAVVGAAGWLDLSPKAIRFKTPEAARLVGIATARLEPRQVQVEIVAHGELQQDPLAMAKVSPRVGGVFIALDKQLGDPVLAGELMALIESSDVGKAKTEYLAAKVALDSREREYNLLSPGSSSQASIVKADAAVRAARAAVATARQAIANLALPLPTADEERVPEDVFARRLALLGIPFTKRLQLQIRAEALGLPLPANLLPLYSPLDGVVVKRSGMVGETIAALQPVFEVSDPTRVYAFLDIRQEDVPKIALGQEMSFRVEGGSDSPESAGRIDWISPTMDDKTRTVRVRARVANPNGALKTGSFGAGTVIAEPSHPALMVPREAVQWEGCSHMVFVKKQEGGETVYQPRQVALGARDERGIEATAGLSAGDEIVVAGSHVLKSELLKGRIGEAEE
jgi:membrane fusion protein, heavy metal efflux system